jgi:hypothetical protein
MTAQRTPKQELYEWFSGLISALPMITPTEHRMPLYDGIIHGPEYEIERFEALYERIEFDEHIEQAYRRILDWMRFHGRSAILAHDLCFGLGVATGVLEKPSNSHERTPYPTQWLGTDHVGAELLTAGLLTELAKREDLDLSNALAKLDPDVLIDALMSVDVDVQDRLAARRAAISGEFANGTGTGEDAPVRESDGAITNKWPRADDAAAERDDGVPAMADDLPTAPAGPLPLLEPGPALPDLPLPPPPPPAPTPATAHPAVDEVAADAPNSGSRRKRWIVGTGAVAAIAAAAAIVIMLASTPDESTSEPAAPLSVTDYTYPTCEPTTRDVPTRTEVGATAPLVRRASLEQFGADMDTVIVRQPDSDRDMRVTVESVPRSDSNLAAKSSERLFELPHMLGLEIGVAGMKPVVVIE